MSTVRTSRFSVVASNTMTANRRLISWSERDQWNEFVNFYNREKVKETRRSTKENEITERPAMLHGRQSTGTVV